MEQHIQSSITLLYYYYTSEKSKVPIYTEWICNANDMRLTHTLTHLAAAGIHPWCHNNVISEYYGRRI